MFLKMNENLIKVNKKNIEVLIDLRYSSNNNFTNEKIYFSDECFIHKIAYEHLNLAVEIAKKQNQFVQACFLSPTQGLQCYLCEILSKTFILPIHTLYSNYFPL